jgi:hypothetical protein
MFVILNEVKNLMISIELNTDILRLSPQNDIAKLHLGLELPEDGFCKVLSI